MLLRITDEQVVNGQISPELLSQEISEKIKELYIIDCANLKIFSWLSGNLVKLNIKNCPNLEFLSWSQSLSRFRRDFLYITVENCPKLPSLSGLLPPTQLNLDIKNCSDLESLSGLQPNFFRELNISNCPIQSLPGLPEGLGTLIIKNCLIQSLPGLPKSLETLIIENCLIQSLPGLPEIFYRLIIKNCPIQSLPGLPKSLWELDIRNCPNLESLSGLPKSLWELDIRNCPNLESLSGLQIDLWELNISNCPIQSLSGLSGAINELTIADCPITLLQSLEYNILVSRTLSVKILKLTDYTDIVASDEIANMLSNFEASGMIVRYPPNFSQNPEAKQAREKLKAAIEKYELLPKPTAIVTLLDRYLTEGIGQRTGKEAKTRRQRETEIALSTFAVLDILIENPEYLAFAEEIAKAFLTGCVNQPVAGWMEICAFIEIARAKTIIDKIIATGYLRVLDEITKYIAQLPAKKQSEEVKQEELPQIAGLEMEAGNALLRPEILGAAVEAEGGNALFREVHKKLLERGNIKKYWLGVPGPIAYEKSITEWLTAEIIEEAYNEAVKVLAQDNTQIAEYLCEGRHYSNWTHIAFPKEVAKIKARYEQLGDDLEKERAIIKEKYAKLMRDLEQESKVEKVLSETKKSIQELQNKKEAELALIDGRLGVLSDNQREREIATTGKKLTFEAFYKASYDEALRELKFRALNKKTTGAPEEPEETKEAGQAEGNDSGKTAISDIASDLATLGTATDSSAGVPAPVTRKRSGQSIEENSKNCTASNLI
jgi:hypothetical protein